MNQIYHYIGLIVFWVALMAWSAACLYFIIRTTGRLLGKLPPWPWLLWACLYAKRLAGGDKYKRKDFPAPVLYNSSPEWREASKKYQPMARKMQANTIRYNRRRWAKQ